MAPRGQRFTFVGSLRALRIALAVSGCLLAPARPTAQVHADSVPPPAALPPAGFEPPGAVEPLRPTSGELPPRAMPWALAPADEPERNTWLDLPHAFLERRIFDVVNGFDRFFADERDLDTLRRANFVRWRNEARVERDGALTLGTAVRAELSLPYLEQRLRQLRIVLENVGNSLDDPEPRAIAGAGAANRSDAVLRWALLDTLTSSIDFGGGVLLRLPPGLVGRARFRYARELGSVALGRVATTGFWNTVDGFGFSASGSLERPLMNRLLARWTTGTVVTEASTTGYQTASELALLATLGNGAALTLLGSGSAESKPEPVLRTWRVASRLRWTFLRRWIFGELEPEVRWTLGANGSRPGTPAVFFRLELQFEAQPAAPPVSSASPSPAASRT